MTQAGIYAISHVATCRRYVGSSGDLRKRLRDHRSQLTKGTHPNQYLQRSWTKYGADAFTMEVLEVVTDLTGLADAEQRHLTIAWPNVFNLGQVAASPLLGRRYVMPESTKQAVRAGHIGRPKSAAHRLAMSLALKGKPITERHKEQLRQMHENNKGRHHDVSDETKAKMRAVHIGKPLSAAHRLAQSVGHKGIVFSDTHRANLRLARARQIAREREKVAK